MLSPSVCWLPLPRGSSSGGERAFLWGDERTFGQFLFFSLFSSKRYTGLLPVAQFVQDSCVRSDCTEWHRTRGRSGLPTQI